MGKIKIMLIVLSLTLCSPASWLLSEPVYADTIPTLKTVPAGLSNEAQKRLTKRHQQIEKERHNFMNAAERFNAKPGEQQSDAEFASLQAQRSQYISLVKSFNREIDLEQQIRGYQETLRRQQKTNEMGLKELEEWTKVNEKSQKEALMAGATVILGKVASDMENRANAARAFKGWMTRYEKAIKEGGIPFATLQPKIEKACQGYVNAMLSAQSGRALKKGMLAKDMWQTIRNEASAINQTQVKADSAAREALNNQKLKKVLETDHAGQELAESLLTMMGQTKELEKIIGPQVELATFLLDYGYAATEWTASRNRIQQQANLKDQELQAVNKLKDKIEKSEKELQKLRAEK